MPWMISPRPKPRRRPGPLARFAADRERVLAWAAAAIGLIVLLGFWFWLARKLA